MRQYFGIALRITKIFASIILVLHMFSGYECFKTVSKSFLPSPNGKFSCSCIIPSESIYTEYVYTKTESYHTILHAPNATEAK